MGRIPSFRRWLVAPNPAIPVPKTTIFFTRRTFQVAGCRYGQRAGLRFLSGHVFQRRGPMSLAPLSRGRQRPAPLLLGPQLVPEPSWGHLDVGELDDLVLGDVAKHDAVVRHRDRKR